MPYIRGGVAHIRIHRKNTNLSSLSLSYSQIHKKHHCKAPVESKDSQSKDEKEGSFRTRVPHTFYPTKEVFAVTSLIEGKYSL